MKIRKIGNNETEVDLVNAVVPVSYETPVAYQMKSTGEYYRTSKYFSHTTSKHINKWIGDSLRISTVPQEKIEEVLK